MSQKASEASGVQEVPTPKAKLKKDPGQVIPSTVSPPVSLYSKYKGTPYLLEKINLEPLYSDEMGHVKQLVNSLDSLMLSEIMRQKMQDTTASYDEVFQKATEEIGLSENVQSLDKLERLLVYFKNKKPLMKMSYEQMKKVLGR